jgi:hypothetical protein
MGSTAGRGEATWFAYDASGVLNADWRERGMAVMLAAGVMSLLLTNAVMFQRRDSTPSIGGGRRSDSLSLNFGDMT